MPLNEPERLKSLIAHKILDTEPEDAYEYITQSAAQICGTPIAFIALVDRNREWLKSKVGLEIGELPREYSFCAHAILNSTEMMVVPDARYDERFYDNPLTSSEPRIIYYAGVPIIDSFGYALGALAVADHRPRKLADLKLLALQILAKLTCTNLELRKVKMLLTENQ